jgi:hypothetical protein
LGHFLHEVEAVTGSDVTPRLERYAWLDPEFIRACGGDQYARWRKRGSTTAANPGFCRWIYVAMTTGVPPMDSKISMFPMSRKGH